MRETPDLKLYYVQRQPPTIPGLAGAQSYFPSLEVLFPSVAEQGSGSPALAASELAVAVDVSGMAVVENLLDKTTRYVPVWLRKTHLVEPVDAAVGEYLLPTDGSLPTFREPWQRTLRKINDPYNEAYTDAVFACLASRLVEAGKSPHWCRFYGTATGRAATYTYDITDDMPDIQDDPVFIEGVKSGAFQVIAVDPYSEEEGALEHHIPVARPALNIDGAVSESEDEEMPELEKSSDSSSSEDEASSESDSASSLGELEEACDAIETDGAVQLRGQRLRLERVTGEQTPSATSESGSESSDGLDYKLVLQNFPVQVSMIERCDGTMDDLMEEEIERVEELADSKEARWTAWMFQVIAALTTAQQLYDFVHNDLHTNNIMWCGTGETHLYYLVTGAPGGDRYYRVPTYGRIFKIIDFGRATFKPVAGGKTWLPDAYAPGADAAGQYNCGDYFDPSDDKVLPNKSFDLCRLAVAMLDTLWPSEPAPVEPRSVLTREAGHVQPETVSPLWNLLWLWLTDKHGKNVLRAPDGSERYPQFDLYCAIARDIQNAIPGQQLSLPLFDSTFRCKRKDIPDDATIWRLQAVAPTVPTAGPRCSTGQGRGGRGGGRGANHGGARGGGRGGGRRGGR